MGLSKCDFFLFRHPPRKRGIYAWIQKVPSFRRGRRNFIIMKLIGYSIQSEVHHKMRMIINRSYDRIVIFQSG